MATNSSRKRSSPSALTAARVKTLVEKLGFNSSLPHALFDAKGHLLYSSRRMGELLVPGADAAARWPFFTEHQSAPALFRTLIVGPLTLVPRELVAEASLKTFKLRVSACALPQQTARLVVAELLRRGDVLADPASKLALFRTLSHEIRTAVQSLKGSLDMWEPKTAADKDVSARMGRSVKRLEKVVGRLEEFRNDLEVEL